MRQYHRPNLLLRNWFLIPALIKATLIDFAGNLVSPHAVSGAGEEEYYSFFKFHL